ncbi:MAG: peptidylprolyl isomerase [Saprospiraceae bacterium]|nr:peptidylprolyl isomerase [Saprospiraceae bacterium]MDW8484270.1 peptidylprolyl isomerase [Saprospiraceae bacterium]
MFRLYLPIAVFLTFFGELVIAQSVGEYADDPVLFTVAQTPVRVSEFLQIYTKSNQQKADFSEASLREYLELYIKFKLKVQKAREMRLDTLPAFRTELEGYRRQLAAAYLVDREVTEKLIREAYEHMKQDVEVSHILIACRRDAPAADTLAAFQRANALLQKALKGADFAQLARDSSEDRSSKENGGYIGFITAILPDGYYAFEKAIYSAQPGIVPYVVRSHQGYHVIKVHSFRPARGEVEVAHILIRKGDSEEANYLKRQKADSAYLAAQRMPWDEACMLYSEDQISAAKGGYIGAFGINRYQRSFEEAAFALDKDGAISPPVETSIGWHIIKRISRRSLPPFEEMRRALADRIKRDSRSELARRSLIQRIQREANFQEYPENLKAWASQQVDSIFHTFRWKPDSTAPQTPLMRYGNRIYTVAEFEEFLVRSSRERMRGLGHPLEQTIANLYQNWVDEAALTYEESQLDKKYPEFRHLMREYEEGMLLFDAAKIEVWDRANTDTAGLQRYFDEHLKNKYLWDERAVVSFYTLKSEDSILLKKVYDFAAKNEPAAVLKKFNKKGEVLVRLEKTYEKGRNKDLENIWRPGGMSEPKQDAATKTASFLKVERLLPPSPKGLSDARGYAVADYQDYLEKKWVEQLRAEYPVRVNEEVFNALIKRQ